MLSVIGAGDDKSVNELRKVIREYISINGLDADLVITTLIDREVSNAELIGVYRKAIDNDTDVFDYIEHDHPYLADVEY